jgi:uncharacterized repeat protein (TIGR02543 family)
MKKLISIAVAITLSSASVFAATAPAQAVAYVPSSAVSATLNSSGTAVLFKCLAGAFTGATDATLGQMEVVKMANYQNVLVSKALSGDTITLTVNPALFNVTDRLAVNVYDMSIACNGQTFSPATFDYQTSIVYALSYNANGGSGTAAVTFGSGTLTTSTGSGLSRAGYSLTGWNTFVDGSGESIALGDTYTPTVSRVLYAQWLAASYTITYDANTGTGTETSTTGAGALTLSSGSNFTRSGYTLSGWNTLANGSGNAVALGASYTPSQNETLYAQWAPLSRTLTYDPNHGAGMISATVGSGAVAVSNGANYTRSGYTLSGWNTAANGSGTAVALGASYTPTQNETLYAQWTAAPVAAASAAYTGPLFDPFSNRFVDSVKGAKLTLTGKGLDAVKSITVAGKSVKLNLVSDHKLELELPAGVDGSAKLTIVTVSGSMSWDNAFTYQNPKFAKVTEFVAPKAVKKKPKAKR